jgi:hypothetical protein
MSVFICLRGMMLKNHDVHLHACTYDAMKYIMHITTNTHANTGAESQTGRASAIPSRRSHTITG